LVHYTCTSFRKVPSINADGFCPKGEDQIWFEGQGTTDGTEAEVAFCIGAKSITSCLLEDVDAEVLKEVVSAI
jgi:hypothetical protein